MSADKKVPFYKNGFLWSFGLVIIGFISVMTPFDSVGLVLVITGIIVFGVTLLRRMFRFFNRKNNRDDVPIQPKQEQPALNTEYIKVSGTSYHQEDIRSLGVENDDYHLPKKELLEQYEGEYVYALDFYPDTKLVPEPTNEYDPNAIRVECEGVLIGYVPKNKTKHIRELMDSQRLHFVSAEIEGGRYKYPDDGEVETGEREYFANLMLEIKADTGEAKTDVSAH